ncbi:hypothetical protein ACFYXV_29260 [Streptomyces sp. NPDC002181]|uniref:hypothetical protein n=1 Tax=Streptomyces sp. NPDC002181 TaxID=3364635 RepID=UPI0036C702E9
MPLASGGVSLFWDDVRDRQYPPSEIVEIDRSLPYDRIKITTTDSIRPVILVFSQDWNVRAWQGLKDRDSIAKSD